MRVVRVLLPLLTGLVPMAASAQSAAPAAASAPEPAGPPSSAAPVPEPSPSGQRAFEAARPRLVQVRTLLKGQDSQASVGSGFLVSEQGHLISNWHVVSDYALQPQRYRLVYATADGSQGDLELVDIDVVHDLALLRPAQHGALSGRGALPFRPPALPLARGERLHALGNPLDVGFAVTEGAYNGLAARSFVPTIFFGGALSGGMSGGPALDERGRVIGVNVATRRDGALVSFLVPAGFAQALLERGRDRSPLALPAWGEVTEQLTAHQQALTDAFVARRWRDARHPLYRLPLPAEDFLRCWGRGSSPDAVGLEFERSDCEMDARVYVGRGFGTAFLATRYEALDGRRLNALRFAQRYSAGFANEYFGQKTAWLTAPQCSERFVDRGVPLRAVMCLRAHKRLPGLYDLALLVATVDQSTAGVQARFDAQGVSAANARRLAAHYLNGIGWRTPPQTLNPPAARDAR
jgi:S1-C subfamily serine protease